MCKGIDAALLAKVAKESEAVMHWNTSVIVSCPLPYRAYASAVKALLMSPTTLMILGSLAALVGGLACVGRVPRVPPLRQLTWRLP